MNTLENQKNALKITYPGITAEVIPGSENIYEIVWNCGGFAALLSKIGNPNIGSGHLDLVIKLLESVKENNSQVILITDSAIIDNNFEMLDAIFTNIFGSQNYRLVGVHITSREKNAISKLQINRSGFTDEKGVLEAIGDLPNATVLSSVPFSDPRIHMLNEKIELQNLQNTVAARTLQLLDFNAKKSNQLEIAGKSMGNIGIAKSHEELEQIFQQHPDSVLVLKDDNGAAGGTTVNFVANNAQRKTILENKNIDFPVLVNEFLHPTCIKNDEGEIFPVQIRPFIDNNQKIIGGGIKFSSQGLREELFSNGGGRASFDKQNKTLNTSSGLTNSFFFDENGLIVSGFRVEGGRFQFINTAESQDFLQNFTFEKTEKKVSGEDFLELTQPIKNTIRDIQEKTNQKIFGV